MLPGQMSPWQLEFVLDVHRNLPLKFHHNRVCNIWDISDVEFVWWVGWCMGWCVGFAESFCCQTQPCVEVRLGFWQYWYTARYTHRNFFLMGGTKVSLGYSKFVMERQTLMGGIPMMGEGSPYIGQSCMSCYAGFPIHWGDAGFPIHWGGCRAIPSRQQDGIILCISWLFEDRYWV